MVTIVAAAITAATAIISGAFSADEKNKEFMNLFKMGQISRLEGINQRANFALKIGMMILAAVLLLFIILINRM